MDSTETWMHTILEWANHTGFLLRTFYSLQKTDIVGFFAKFRQRISTVEIKQINLQQFIEAYYPDYKTELDLDGELHTDSYIYIYSLLLHFACVRYPQADMHHMCKGLSERSQVRIAAFFTALMHQSSINRSVLDAAIADSNASSDRSELMSPLKSFSSSGGSVGDGSVTFSPPTPRSKQMDYWNVENKQLKASLETARYERSTLEDQLKQFEDKIAVLQAEKQRHIIYTNQLKNELLTKNIENESPNNNPQDEQIKQRLRKQIASKDDEIVQLTTSIDAMRDENLTLRGKFQIAEHKNQNLSEQVQDFVEMISSIRNELSIKEENLQQLQKGYNDLEQLLRDSRITYAAENPFDMSVECLDASRSSDTSKSVGSLDLSPESLGHTVIDKQLREQKSQNEQFSVKLVKAEAENARLVNNMNEIIQNHSTQMNKLQADLAEQEVKEEEQRRQIEDHLKEIEGQRNINSQLRADHQQAIQEIQAKYEILINEKKILLDYCERLKKNVDEECARHDRSKLEFMDIDQRHQELLATLQSDLSTEKVKCDNLTKSIEESEKRFVETERLQVECESKLSVSGERVAEVQTKLLSAEQLLEKTILDCNKKIIEIDNSSQLARDTLIRNHSIEMAAHEEKLQDLSEQISRNLNEMSEKNFQIDELKLQLNAEEVRSVEYASKLEIADNEILRLNSEIIANTVRQNELAKVSSMLEQCEITLVEKSEWLTVITQRLMDSESMIQSKDKEISYLRRCQFELEEAISFKEAQSKEISALQEQIDKILSEKQELEERLAALTTIEVDIKEQLNAMKIININLSNERDKFVHHVELEKAEQQIKFQSLQAECESLTLTCANNNQVTAAINDKNRELEENYVEQSVQLEEMRSQVMNLKLENKNQQQNQQAEVKAITDQLKGNCDIPDHSTKIVELETKCKDFEKNVKKLNEMTLECARLIAVIEIEKQNQVALNDVVATFKSDLAAEKSISSSLKNAGEVQQRRVEEVEANYARVDRLLKASESEIAAIKLKLHDAEQFLAATILDNDKKAQAEFDKLASEHSKKLTIVEKKLKILNKEQTHICQENIQKNAIIDELLEKLKVVEKLNLELKANIMRSAEEVIELKVNLSANIELQNEYEKATNELGECSGRLLQATSALQVSKDTALASAALNSAEIAKLQQNIDSLLKIIQEKDEELATLRDLKSEHEQILNVKETQTIEIINFQEQISQILLEKSKLQEQVSQLAVSVSDVNDQLNSARSSNTKLTIERQELSQQIELAYTELKSVQLDSSEKLKSLQTECESLTQTCAVLKHKTDELTNINRELLSKDNASCAEKKLASEKMAAFLERIHALEKEKDELDRDVSVAMKHRMRVEELQLQLEEMSLVQKKHTRLQQDYADMQLSLSELSESLNDELKKQSIVKNESEADFYKNPAKYVVQTIDHIQRIKEDQMQEYKNEISGMKQQLESLESVQKDNIHLKETCSAVTTNLNKISKDYDELKKAQADEMVEMRLQIERLKQEHQQEVNQNNQGYAEQNKQYESLQLEADKWKGKYEAAILADCDKGKSIAILNAKLKQHRTLTDKKTEQWQAERDELQNNVKLAESRVTETRMELEGKLEKMKIKMKILYTDEVKKIKEKNDLEHKIYEEEHNKHKSKIQELQVNLQNHAAHNSKLAGQIFQLNESALELKKQNEVMKNQLQMNQPISRSRLPQSSSMSSLIKMEDEEGELFNEVFLEQLKSGTYRPPSPARDSLTVKEMQYRNSLLLPHMRSTYLPQCVNQQYSEEDIKMLRPSESHNINDESIVSVQSAGEVRRGRLYQKPGPPTPSKNGARLSLGATTSAELNSFRETLKENNNFNGGIGKGGIGRTPKGKMSSLFSSKKKDENSSPKRRLSMNIFKKNSNR